IPADRNGIKFYRPNGEIDKADEAAITQYVAERSNVYDPPAPAETAWPSHHDEAVAGYLERANGILGPDSLSGMRIGVYQHSSVAAELLVQVLRSFGAEAVPVGKSQTFVPVDTEAVDAGTLAKLKG
ncbi:phosphomannomutase, partial [Mesorhizobium sp. M2A.F.Ca.ET.037.01.1.1]